MPQYAEYKSSARVDGWPFNLAERSELFSDLAMYEFMDAQTNNPELHQANRMQVDYYLGSDGCVHYVLKSAIELGDGTLLQERCAELGYELLQEPDGLKIALRNSEGNYFMTLKGDEASLFMTTTLRLQQRLQASLN